VLVLVNTELAVLKWISGRPTQNQLKSPLTLAQSKVKLVVKAISVVTSKMVRDMKVTVIKMVATIILIDWERPISMAPVVSTPSIPPRR